MVLYQSKRSARRSQDEWCGLRHIGTHLSREYNHQWFSFPLSVEWYVKGTLYQVDVMLNGNGERSLVDDIREAARTLAGISNVYPKAGPYHLS